MSQGATSAVPAEQQAQFEAHVAFELAQLTGDAGQAFIARELQLAWDKLNQMPLNSFVSEARAVELLQRYLCTLDVTPELLEAIGKSAHKLLELPANQAIALDSLVTESDRKALVDKAIELEKLRHELIQMAVANPLYASTVTDLLYHGIRDYIAAGSELTKKVPGVGGMLNRGSNMLGKRMQAIEERVEEKIRSYIQSNMQGILERSEKMLEDQLTPTRLRQFADEGWRAVSARPLAIGGYVTAEQCQSFSQIGGAIWQRLRSSEWFAAAMQQTVSAFYSDYGEMTVADAAALLGLELDQIIVDCQQNWQDLQPKLSASGYLEASIRQRLASFYATL